MFYPYVHTLGMKIKEMTNNFSGTFFLKDKRSKNCRWYVGRKSFYSSRKNSSHKNCAIKAALRAWKKTTTTAVKSWKEKVRKSWTECKNCKESSCCCLVFSKQISETCCHTASFTVFYILSFFCCTNPLSGYTVIRAWSNFDQDWVSRQKLLCFWLLPVCLNVSISK